MNGQKKGANGHKTGDGHATGSWTCVTATGHAGPRDCQMNVSAIVETASEPDGTGSSPKTVTGTAKTVHWQKGSVTSHDNSAFVHETANGNNENLDLAREMIVKSVSGSGPQ